MPKRALKRRKNIRPQPVADAQTDSMGAIPGARRRVEKIAAQFADIDEQRAAVPNRVAPEFARGEALANIARAADRKSDADRDDAAVGMVHRQAIVHAVLALSVRRGGKAEHDAQHARMGDARRLGQSGRARGEDEQRAVVDRQRGTLLRGEGASLNVSTSSSMRGSPPPVSPWAKTARSAAQPLARARELGRQRSVDDGRLGADDGDAMGERGPGQIGVDQRRRHADAREAHPDRDIFRPVGHHQATASPLPSPRASAQRA